MWPICLIRNQRQVSVLKTPKNGLERAANVKTGGTPSRMLEVLGKRVNTPQRSQQLKNTQEE
jgi:hypothetical protein